MDAAQYIFSVSVAALICALVKRISEGTSIGRSIVRLLCGALMAISIVSPLRNGTFSYSVGLLDEIRFDANSAVAYGEDYYRRTLAQNIIDRTEAYILQRANRLHAEISVEVTVSDDVIPIPKEVVIGGQISPYAKRQLQSILANDLGIAKENQTWI